MESQYRRSSNPCGHKRKAQEINCMSQYRRSSNPCGQSMELPSPVSCMVSIPPQQ